MVIDILLSMVLGILLWPTAWYNGIKQYQPRVLTRRGEHNSISISFDSPLDETFNGGPLALLLRRQYEFPFGVIVL